MRKITPFLFAFLTLSLLGGIASAQNPNLYEIRVTRGVTRVCYIYHSDCANSYIVDESSVDMFDLFTGCSQKDGCFGMGYVLVEGEKEPRKVGVLLHEVSLTAAQNDKIRDEAREQLRERDAKGRKTIYTGLEKIFPGEFNEERYQNLLEVADSVCQCDQKYKLLQEALDVKFGGQEAYWVAHEIEFQGYQDNSICECRWIVTDKWETYSGRNVSAAAHAATAPPVPIVTSMPTNPPMIPTPTPVSLDSIPERPFEGKILRKDPRQWIKFECRNVKNTDGVNWYDVNIEDEEYTGWHWVSEHWLIPNSNYPDWTSLVESTPTPSPLPTPSSTPLPTGVSRVISNTPVPTPITISRNKENVFLEQIFNLIATLLGYLVKAATIILAGYALGFSISALLKSQKRKAERKEEVRNKQIRKAQEDFERFVEEAEHAITICEFDEAREVIRRANALRDLVEDGRNRVLELETQLLEAANQN